LNTKTLLYNPSTAHFEYQVSGIATFSVDDVGNVTASGNIAAAGGSFDNVVNFEASGSTLGTIQANGGAFINYNGTSVVGLSLSGGTYSQDAIRIAANQTFSWEDTGAITTQYNSSSLSWQFKNNSAVEFEISTSLGQSYFSGSVGVGGSSGPYWKSGTGVPAYSAAKGSMYSRTDGGLGSTLYVSQGAGTWNAAAGV